MEFGRVEGIGKGRASLKFSDLESYIEQIVDMVTVTDALPEEWLTKTEKRFLVATAILTCDGVTNPISNLAVQIYKKYFNYQVDRKVINKYLTALVKKGWIEYDIQDKYVKVPLICRDLGKEKDSMEFTIKIEYDEAHKRNNDGDST